MYRPAGAFSYSPRAIVQDDFPPQRRPYQEDDRRSSPILSNSFNRPSGKSIYRQRKEYSETVTKQNNTFHVRVEHLLTCELDGSELKTLDDCLGKLKWLDTKGRVWGQEMVLDVHKGYLTLSDIETKTDLEELPLSSITQTQAVMNSCAYNSLLTITVQERSRRTPQVFIFQCDEMGADLLKTDLDKAIQRRDDNDDDVRPRRDQTDIRSNLESIIGQQRPGGFQQQRSPAPSVDQPLPQWPYKEPENAPPPWEYAQEERFPPPDLHVFQRSSPDIPSDQGDTETNTVILNHVLSDVELFLDKVSAVVNSEPPQKEKSKMKGLRRKKSIKKQSAGNLPSTDECVVYLQQVKYGFNLLGQLDGSLTSPSASDYIHILFNTLSLVKPLYPAELPPSVVSPLLTEAALALLAQEVGPGEEQLWMSLGEAWNTPRSRWANNNVPPFIPQFSDGWQPPAPSRIPSPLPYRNGPESRSGEAPLYMQVAYTFAARNRRELNITKGEVVQVIQKSKQWWLVRNNQNEEGNVPMNVLEPMSRPGSREDFLPDPRGQAILSMTSSPAEVKAWLHQKGFSRITVNSLGVLTGKLLLGMNKDEIRTVCPEEGGKVFFQLQAIKSSIALAGESQGPYYNGRY